MTIACATLRHGAKDAWVVDDHGGKVADFAAINKHCAAALSDALPKRCSSSSVQHVRPAYAAILEMGHCPIILFLAANLAVSKMRAFSGAGLAGVVEISDTVIWTFR
jgi:hypothetical protein